MGEAVKVVLFLLWINFLPPLANVIWKESFNRPLDGNRVWSDGRPLFGPHKTIRGILASVLGSLILAPFLGLPWFLVGGAALLAMAGDLWSSFIKRRFNYQSGDTVPVLDQLFEGLLPLMLLAHGLALAWWQGLLVMAIFIPITSWGSWFWQHILFRPPVENYLRIIRSSVRLREWRACHQPLARWHTWFNFPNFIFYRMVMTWFFKATGLYSQGVRNTLDIRVQEETFHFSTLPPSFEGFRILLLTDLHLDGLEELTPAIIDKIQDLEVDLCLIGGDIRMEVYGAIAPSLRYLRRLIGHIRSRHGIFGVLGNHDCIEMVPDFEEAGLLMLVNDSQVVEQQDESIWIIGIDDPHYYKCHDLDMAFRGVPAQGFKILLAHSPEAYFEAAPFQPQLYLCGHTHGGQICLPGKGPLYANSRAPRFTAVGRWAYRDMIGYTSRGSGASGVPIRYNCPGEITLVTLRCIENRDVPGADT
jgi:predicted MPP superfamily phosphohydrolase